MTKTFCNGGVPRELRGPGGRRSDLAAVMKSVSKS